VNAQLKIPSLWLLVDSKLGHRTVNSWR